MIRIIRGTYGFRDARGVLQPKTPADGPFEETPEQEKRLIALGVAEAVNKSVTAKKKEAEKCQSSKTKSKRTSKTRS